MWTTCLVLLLWARLMYIVNDVFRYAEVCDPGCDKRSLKIKTTDIFEWMTIFEALQKPWKLFNAKIMYLENLYVYGRLVAVYLAAAHCTMLKGTHRKLKLQYLCMCYCWAVNVPFQVSRQHPPLKRLEPIVVRLYNNFVSQ